MFIHAMTINVGNSTYHKDAMGPIIKPNDHVTPSTGHVSSENELKRRRRRRESTKKASLYHSSPTRF